MKKIMNLAIAVILLGSCDALLFAVNYKSIPFISANGAERVDIDEVEPLQNTEFKDLIEAKQAEGKAYIIARVVSQDAGGRRYIRYFDANGLNSWLFMEGFEGHEFQPISEYKDPVNNTPMASIDYFAIESVNDTDFTALCSFDDLANNVDDWRGYFNANEPIQARELSAEVLLDRGYQYLNGYDADDNPMPVDYAKALNYFERATRQEDDPWSCAEANGELSGMYREGQGVAQSEERADHYYQEEIRIYNELAEQEADPAEARDALIELGHLYQSGLHPDAVRARDYYLRVAQQVEDLAEASHAKYHLGELYFSGHQGIDKNYAIARDYLIDVVNAQLVDSWYMLGAQERLADIYFAGDPEHGVAKDYAQAIHYYDSVANQQEELWRARGAQLKLGNLYFHGDVDQGFAKDYVRARDYYLPVANQQESPWESAMAKYELGNIYFLGSDSIPRNYAQARDYYLQAENQGDLEEENQDGLPRIVIQAKEKLGDIYFTGDPNHGVAKDYAQAITYYTPVANQQKYSWMTRPAQLKLGDIYFMGDPNHGIAKDYVRAVDYYTLLVDQHEDYAAQLQARFKLGKIYFEGGHGVEKDDARVREYFTDLYYTMNEAENDEIRAVLRQIASSEAGSAVEGSGAANRFQLTAEEEKIKRLHEELERLRLEHEAGLKALAEAHGVSAGAQREMPAHEAPAEIAPALQEEEAEMPPLDEPVQADQEERQQQKLEMTPTEISGDKEKCSTADQSSDALKESCVLQ